MEQSQEMIEMIKPHQKTTSLELEGVEKGAEKSIPPKGTYMAPTERTYQISTS